MKCCNYLGINFHYLRDLKFHFKFCELLHVGASICEQIVDDITEKWIIHIITHNYM